MWNFRAYDLIYCNYKRVKINDCHFIVTKCVRLLNCFWHEETRVQIYQCHIRDDDISGASREAYYNVTLRLREGASIVVKLLEAAPERKRGDVAVRYSHWLRAFTTLCVMYNVVQTQHVASVGESSNDPVENRYAVIPLTRHLPLLAVRPRDLRVKSRSHVNVRRGIRAIRVRGRTGYPSAWYRSSPSIPRYTMRILASYVPHPTFLCSYVLTYLWTRTGTEMEQYGILETHRSIQREMRKSSNFLRNSLIDL